MVFESEGLQFLTQIGLTKTQAKLYLALLKFGQVDGKTLAKNSESPRPVVYRTLDELQEMGLVEKEITNPYKFRATPLKEGVQILMAQKLQKYKQNRKNSDSFILKYDNHEKVTLPETQYKFIALQGKERIIQKLKLQHKKVQQSVKILTNLNRWLLILHYCYEDYMKALLRNVKYQTVIETCEPKYVFPKHIQSLLSKKNFELRLVNSSLTCNLRIFDNQEAIFSFSTSTPLTDSPIIFTNHPGFQSMCQDHFEKVWKSAKKYQTKASQGL